MRQKVWVVPPVWGVEALSERRLCTQARKCVLTIGSPHAGRGVARLYLQQLSFLLFCVRLMPGSKVRIPSRWEDGLVSTMGRGCMRLDGVCACTVRNDTKVPRTFSSDGTKVTTERNSVALARSRGWNHHFHTPSSTIHTVNNHAVDLPHCEQAWPSPPFSPSLSLLAHPGFCLQSTRLVYSRSSIT